MQRANQKRSANAKRAETPSRSEIRGGREGQVASSGGWSPKAGFVLRSGGKRRQPQSPAAQGPEAPVPLDTGLTQDEFAGKKGTGGFLRPPVVANNRLAGGRLGLEGITHRLINPRVNSNAKLTSLPWLRPFGLSESPSSPQNPARALRRKSGHNLEFTLPPCAEQQRSKV